MATTFDIQLPHYSRGFHLITRDIVSHLPELPESGLLVVFIKHTSAESQSTRMQIPMFVQIFRLSSTSWFRTGHLISFIHWRDRMI